MGSIPLPALQVRPPEQPDIIGQAQKAVALKSLLQQQQQQAAMAPGEQELQRQMIESQALTIEQQKRDKQDQELFSKAFMQSGGDPEKAINIAAKSGASLKGVMGARAQLMEYRSKLGIMHETELKNMQLQANLIGQAANAVVNAPDEKKDEIYQQSRAFLAQSGISPDQIPPQRPPDDILKAHALSAMTVNQQVDNALKEREQKFKETIGAPVEAQELNAYLRNHPGKTPEDFARWKASLAPTATFNLQGSLLTPEAQQMAAQNYAQTGQLPTGMRSPAMSAKILNQAASAPGGIPDIAAAKATYGANTGSLKHLQQQFDQVSAFENTAGKNLDVFLKEADKITDLGAKFLDTPLRMVQRNVLGTADLAAFDAARTTALTEIAKVLNSPTGAGVLSDAARKEAEGLIGPNATLRSIKSAANILKQDMKNRHDAYQQQIQDIKGRMGNTETPEEKPSGRRLIDFTK